MNRNPFDTEYDVAVLGGGMCGLGAGLSIAAAGKRVLLVERRQALGWEVTSAFHCSYRKSDSPTAECVRRRLSAIGGLRGDRVDAPFLEYVLDQMVEDAGIDLLFYSQPTDLMIEGDWVSGVMVGNKSGEQRLRAKAYVDATEGAILWRRTHTDWLENRDARSAVGSVFFNMGKADVELPYRLGNLDELYDIVAYPSVREREVCVEYTLPHYSIPDTRLALDRLVTHVRAAVPALRDAMVTHASFEPYPLAPAVIRTGDPTPAGGPRNLFAAGIWAVRDGAERQKANTIAGRLGWGEAVGIEVVKTLADLPRPSPGDISNSTTEPPTMEADVIVAGGGTAGSLAAIAAGRQGTKVILLEMSTVLGGMVTSGGVSWEGHGVKGGLQDEHYDREARRRALYSGAYDSPRIHPESGKIALDAMCREAGVEIVYGAAAVGAEMEGSHIRGVIAATPRGKIIYRGDESGVSN